MSRYELLHGDCLEKLKELPDCSVDAVVTDPPYELAFMGKKWDASGIAFRLDVWLECLRVLKPGGHLLAFGGTRTYHRMACAIEDAGFEVRDSIHWMYGSGFPKGLRPVPHMWQSVKSCLSKERAPHVVQISPSLRPASQEGKELTALTLAVIQPEGVPALLTETGKADGSSEVTVTLLSESVMRQAAIDLSMISSWKGSLDEDFDAVNTSIIETTSNTTTVQKILSYLIGQNTSSSIRHSVTLRDGSRWPACDAENLLRDERLKSQPIPVLTALATATKNPLREFAGWNVNLKPAHEPIVVARKPLIGTVAQNVLAHGTGAINVDGCRLDGAPPSVPQPVFNSATGRIYGMKTGEGRNGQMSAATGRWPPNVVFSHLPACDLKGCAEGCAVRELDEQSGMLKSGGGVKANKGTAGLYGIASNVQTNFAPDSGGASRFFPAFRYQAKAPARERKVEGMAGQSMLVLRDDITDEDRAFVLKRLRELGLDPEST